MTLAERFTPCQQRDGKVSYIKELQNGLRPSDLGQAKSTSKTRDNVSLSPAFFIGFTRPQSGRTFARLPEVHKVEVAVRTMRVLTGRRNRGIQRIPPANCAEVADR